jgi:hypothetical protein
MSSIAKAVATGLVFLVGASAADAQAQQGPYMWGVGVKLGTSFIPGQYPIAFPAKIDNYDFIDEDDPSGLGGTTDGDLRKRDVDENGEARYSTLQRVGFDGRIGAEGFYGIDPMNRVGAGFGFGLGRDYFDGWFTLNYDRVLSNQGTFALVAGGQVGYGSVRFDGDEDLPGGDNEYLQMPYYPLRLRAQGQFTSDTTLLGVGFFGQLAVPARTIYVDLDGVEQPAVGGFGNFLLNPMVGIEVDLQFGDFVPPRPKGAGGKGKKAGGGAGGGGGGGGGGSNQP